MRRFYRESRLRSKGFFILALMCLLNVGIFFTCANAETNNSPETIDYTYTIYKNQSVTNSVYGSDADGDTLSYYINVNPLSGTAIVNLDGSWTYTPVDNFIGEDSFRVKVVDEHDAFVLSSIKVIVNDNNFPTVPDYRFRVYKNNSVTNAVYGSDVDGDILIYEKFCDPANGSVDVSSNGVWTYTPDHDFIGIDYFQVSVNDGKGGFAVSKIRIYVKKKTHSHGSDVSSSIDDDTEDNDTDNENNAISEPAAPVIQSAQPVQNLQPTQNLQQNNVMPNAAAFEEQSVNSQVPVLKKQSVEKKKVNEKVEDKKIKEKIPGEITKLPKTGGVPPFIFYGMGGMFMTAGILLRRFTK